MTYEVFVSHLPKNLDKDKIEKDFKKIHDMSLSNHGINWTNFNKHGFFVVQCHWNFAHMTRTIADLLEVLNTNGIKKAHFGVSY